MPLTIHNIINSYSLYEGGAERLARRLHAGLCAKGLRSRLIGLTGSEEGSVSSGMFCLGLRSTYSYQALSATLNYVKHHVQDGDILHAHLSPTIFYCALAKHLSPRRFHLLTTEHNSHNNRRGQWHGRLLDSGLYRTMDRIICISKGTQSSLHGWMPVTCSKTLVIHNGVSLHFDRFNTRPQCNVVRVVSVGRLHRQKNLTNALHAFALVWHAYGAGEGALQTNDASIPQIEYHIAGSGELEPELRRLAEELGVSNQVHFLGHVDAVCDLLKDADIFLMPSLWEGFGLAAVEAMNAGLPVIASDVEGLREVVVGSGGAQEACALLVDPQKPQSIADALRQLIQSPQLRQELGRRGFERASQFSEDKMIEGYAELYASLDGLTVSHGDFAVITPRVK